MCLLPDNYSARGLASTYQDGSCVEPIEAPYQGPSESRTTASSTRLQKSEAERTKICREERKKKDIRPPPRGSIRSCLFTSVTGMSRMAANERWSEGGGDRERGAMLAGDASWRC